MAPLLLAFACAPGEAGPTSFVIVSLDTTRADRLGAYGATRDTTPNLDRFAAESTLFTRAYSQSTTTGPSHVSLFTSRYPLELQAEQSSGVPPEVPMLAEVFRAYGYRTGAFVAGGDLNPEIFETRGFDTWASSVDFGSLWHTVPMALEWLDAGSDPFLLFVHGYDAHGSYLKPAPFGFAYGDAQDGGLGAWAVRNHTERVIDGMLLDQLTPFESLHRKVLRPRSAEGREELAARASEAPMLEDADIELIRDVYDGAVAYEDMIFGRLMAGLQSRGVLDRAVVVVLSDHGEQLGEYGMFHHCCGTSDEETHVPLMVRLPGGGPARRVDAVTELVDVMPTVLELAGATSPAGARGRSFAAALRGEPYPGRATAFSTSGLRMDMASARAGDGRLTYAGMQLRHALVPDLIEVARLPGPGFEASEGTSPATQSRLRTELTAWLRSVEPAPTDQPAREKSPELESALRARGYWDPDEE